MALASSCADINADGGEARSVAVDIAVQDSVQAMVEETVGRLGSRRPAPSRRRSQLAGRRTTSSRNGRRPRLL
jgi:hypothetical protein